MSSTSKQLEHGSLSGCRKWHVRNHQHTSCAGQQLELMLQLLHELVVFVG